MLIQTRVRGFVAAYETQDRRWQREHKFEKAQQYSREFNPGATAADFEKLRPWLKAFTDVEIMADMFSSPREFLQWMNAISEPQAVYLMMKCSTEPVMWDTWLHGLTDFETMMRVSMRFTNPLPSRNPMVGMFDPQLYTTMIALFDPQSVSPRRQRAAERLLRRAEAVAARAFPARPSPVGRAYPPRARGVAGHPRAVFTRSAEPAAVRDAAGWQTANSLTLVKASNGDLAHNAISGEWLQRRVS